MPEMSDQYVGDGNEDILAEDGFPGPAKPAPPLAQQVPFEFQTTRSYPSSTHSFKTEVDPIDGEQRVTEKVLVDMLCEQRSWDDIRKITMALLNVRRHAKSLRQEQEHLKGDGGGNCSA